MKTARPISEQEYKRQLQLNTDSLNAFIKEMIHHRKVLGYASNSFVIQFHSDNLKGSR